MAKKWTKAEREAASIEGKKRWAARKKQDVRFSKAPAPPSDGSANTYRAVNVLTLPSRLFQCFAAKLLPAPLSSE